MRRSIVFAPVTSDRRWGIPVAIKDNVAVAGDVTTHGTGAYGPPAAADCEVVRRVKEAGAIVIGRTHVPPLCAMACTESSAWGITRNPWDTARTPGGSSGGSAVAVAAGMVPFALGSDGAGSIRVPSAFCGLFGLKPQRGRISLAPMAEHWKGMTALGWLTRSVRDAAIVYDATLGSTDVDADRPPKPGQSFLEAANSEPQRLRIAWSVELPLPAKAMTRVDPRIKAAVHGTAELLTGLGHDVVERSPDYPPLLPLAATARCGPLIGAPSERRRMSITGD
jgi:amidase